MKFLITGANGQLGSELAKVLPDRGHEIVSLDRSDLDVANFASVKELIENHKPDIVVNAAAYTNVDGCETDVDLAFCVNSLGPRNLAQVCQRSGVEFLHVGTNYVFDGAKQTPYETFDAPNPISVYGRTKLLGEEYARQLSTRWYVVRSAGVYGEGHNFVRTMLRVAKERDFIKVKDDEFISPTYALDLAEGIAEIVEARRYGVYHMTNSGHCSWYEFTKEIFRVSGIEIEVEGIPGSEFPLPAPRPANGVLSNLGSPTLPHWKDALTRYLKREEVVN